MTAALLAAALCLSAALCSSASTSVANSGWVGRHRFTLIEYHRLSIPPSGYGIAVVSHNKRNTFCQVSFKGEHHLSPGTVFTGYVAANQSNTGHGCEYREWGDIYAPIKVVGHVSRIAVRGVIENMPPESNLAFAPKKYRFANNDGGYFGEGYVSYSARAAKAVRRAEASGKAVTVRIKISKRGLRHLGFVR
ncbi:MAG: hypothetical protein ACYDHO_06025 [Gaiellaceae bacterium]